MSVWTRFTSSRRAFTLLELLVVIATLHSGNDGWDGNFKYRLWIYGADSKVRNESPAWQNGVNHVAVQAPESSIAIMERAVS